MSFFLFILHSCISSVIRVSISRYSCLTARSFVFLFNALLVRPVDPVMDEK